MIEVKPHGAVARVFLDRREKANALDSRLLKELLEAFRTLSSVCQAIRALPVPVVARLHGAVMGAGLEIAREVGVDEAVKQRALRARKR